MENNKQPEISRDTVKADFLERLREQARELSAKSDWYRNQSCTHLSELFRVEHRSLWEIIGIVEKAQSKVILLDQLFSRMYVTDASDFFVHKGLIELAEFAYFEFRVCERVFSLAKTLAEF